MGNKDEDRAFATTDADDIEELMAEGRRGYDPSPQERWNSTVELAKALMGALPGIQVSSGAARSRLPRVDYIPPAANPPLNVFGPDGRFIVSFLGDGRWIEADGRIASTTGIIESSPEALARELIRVAGLELPRDTSKNRPWRRQAPPSEKLQRLLEPRPTNTWRDNVGLPVGQNWDEHTPASICRESQASRLIAVPYDEYSCTFSRTSHPRWGIESLRIPDFAHDPRYPTWKPPIDPIHIGDCLLTFGEKFESDEEQLQFDHEIDGVRLWFPQRVVRVEPEGAGHLRVWLAVDRDVINDNATPEELTVPIELPRDQPRLLTSEEALQIWRFFQLDVFCRECGNRGKPLVYGMPTSTDPSYLVIGVCVIEPNQPRYTCYCGNAWTGDEEAKL